MAGASDDGGCGTSDEKQQGIARSDWLVPAVLLLCFVIVLGILWRIGIFSDEDANARTDLIAILGAGLGAAVSWAIAAYSTRRNDEAQRKQQQQFNTIATNQNEARLLNERFAVAAAQLGHKEGAVRLAGVYAMASLADDYTNMASWAVNRTSNDGRAARTSTPAASSGEDGAAADTAGYRAQACLDVLCGFLRLPDKDETDPRHNREVRKTIIALIRDHLVEKAEVSWRGYDFNFTGATFEGGSFEKARFEHGVSFYGATFSGYGVSFENTEFNCGTGKADFGRAKFVRGHTNFGYAKFNCRANFGAAEFQRGHVNFGRTEFSIEADFGGALFVGAKVDFGGARFCQLYTRKNEYIRIADKDSDDEKEAWNQIEEGETVGDKWEAVDPPHGEDPQTLGLFKDARFEPDKKSFEEREQEWIAATKMEVRDEEYRAAVSENGPVSLNHIRIAPNYTVDLTNVASWEWKQEPSPEYFTLEHGKRLHLPDSEAKEKKHDEYLARMGGEKDVPPGTNDDEGSRDRSVGWLS